MNACLHSQQNVVSASSAGGAPAATNETRRSRGVVKYLIAPAVVACLMFGAHWNVFGSVSQDELQAMEDEPQAEYFPAEYAFRAADFDDPVNSY